MLKQFSYEQQYEDKNSRARSGIIHTGHGDIATPSFVAVGTQAAVKSLSGDELKTIGTQVFFVNTYHMWMRPGIDLVEKFGGLHRFMNWNRPLMTDSAGFQVFSLARPGAARTVRINNEDVEVPLVKIGEEGVHFRSHLDGSEHYFTPESSITAQTKLGADMMISFDECTFHPATRDYTKAAMERTHRWALRSLKSADSRRDYQALYGSIQGGVYRELREQSADYLSSLPFDGMAIGGVSVGESKEEMRTVLDWVMPRLPADRPRHLLGVGEIDDIFTLVERGVDTFDCVLPTRLGRIGQVLVETKRVGQDGKTRWTMDITKQEYREDESPISDTCGCWVCQTYSRGYVHHLFRANELLAYRLASFHNLAFMEKLMVQIRESIKQGSFSELKKEWL